MIQLRDYQQDQLNFLLDNLPLSDRLAVESPTGSGKTFVMLELAIQWLKNNPLGNVVISTGFNNLVHLMEKRAEENGIKPIVLIGTGALNCPEVWKNKLRSEELGIPQEFRPFMEGNPCMCGTKHLALDTTARTPAERVCPFVQSVYQDLLGKIANGVGNLIITNHSTFLAHQEAGTFHSCDLLMVDEAHTFGTYYDSWMSVELSPSDLLAVEEALFHIKPPMNLIIRKNIENSKPLPAPQLEALLEKMSGSAKRNVADFFSIKPGPANFFEHGENWMKISRFYRAFDCWFPHKTVLFTATLDDWTIKMFNVRRTFIYRERKQFCDYSKSEFIALPREDFEVAFKEFLQHVNSKGLKNGLCLSTTVVDVRKALAMSGYLGYTVVDNLEEFEKLLAKNEPNKKYVLCGSRRFFQGVDIKNLQFVCLNRIPFPNWDDKAKALQAYITDNGTNSINHWKEFTVPKTQNDMLQSSGRLWRDIDSAGVVGIFDTRLERFSYMMRYVFDTYRHGIKTVISREPGSLEDWPLR